MLTTPIAHHRTPLWSVLLCAALTLTACTDVPVQPTLGRARMTAALAGGTSMADAIPIAGAVDTALFSIPVNGAMWFRWTPPSPGWYRFTTCGFSWDDTTIELFDANGALMASNDDDCAVTPLQSTIVAQFTTNPVYVRVSGFGGTTVTGKLVWTPMGGSRQLAAPLTGTSGIVSGAIASSKSFWYALNLPAGTYVFSTCHRDGGTASFDTQIELSDAAGNIIASNDDGAGCEYFRSRIERTLPAGQYVVRIFGYLAEAGQYTLSWRRTSAGFDPVPPELSLSVSPFPNVGGWNRSPVSIVYSAIDRWGSGLQYTTCQFSGATAGGFTSTRGADGAVVSNDGVTTVTCVATDNENNASEPVSRTIRLDQVPPSVEISSPADGAVYYEGESRQGVYTCSDALSGVQCVDNGIDTRTPGVRTYTVTGTDGADNQTTRSVSYEVRPLYEICPIDGLKDVKSGGVIPVKVRVCRYDGANVSAPDLRVHAERISVASGGTWPVLNAGRSNDGGDFRYDPDLAGYIFNLGTRGLASGMYQLVVQIGDQAVERTVSFTVR